MKFFVPFIGSFFVLAPQALAANATDCIADSQTCFNKQLNREALTGMPQANYKGSQNQVKTFILDFFTFNPNEEAFIVKLAEKCPEVLEGISSPAQLESRVIMNGLEVERAGTNMHKYNNNPISRVEPVYLHDHVKGQGFGEIRAAWFAVDYRDNPNNQVSLTHLGMISTDGRWGILGNPEHWDRGITIPKGHDLVLCMDKSVWKNFSHFGVGAGSTNTDGSRPVLQLKATTPAAAPIEVPTARW